MSDGKLKQKQEKKESENKMIEKNYTPKPIQITIDHEKVKLENYNSTEPFTKNTNNK